MSNILEIHDLCVEIDGEEILHHINLTVPYGEVHAVLGPNGGGKTSLMMTIMGFSGYHVTRGEIRFDGTDIVPLSITERARLGIAVAQQRPPTIQGVRLEQVIDYHRQRDPKSGELIDRYLGAANMNEFLPREINAGLSGGEIRRSELFQLLAMRPMFAMLDEPDSGVDIGSIELVGRMINEIFSQDPLHPAKRRAGLIITHNGNMLEHIFTDKAHVIIDGKLACSGNPRIILETACSHGYENCAACIRGELIGLAKNA
ncbi:MAG: ABC transporter ATP-binding protein [Anaerolineaceae bacterium]|nr:ABC transporter ATP-binding protein [Anaerolineaceae bacterium]